MKILCKYPTRGRPSHFLDRLREWTSMASEPANIAWLVSYDADDETMTPEVIAEAEKIHPSVICVRGNSKTKIEACNADVNEYGADWNIILLVSDDMFCRRHGWDAMIRKEMKEEFPDTDGSLWFFDGSQKSINTLTCFGYAYYKRRNYLYHPAYKSLWCDNEQTDVGLRDKRLVFIPTPICSHEHPAWGAAMKKDALYEKNGRYWNEDKATYYARKSLGFP